ncbi:MAG: ATP-dependent DNA ligase [Rubellimicrobium sp.]|nr:ATP-dependent DNA ligase [Rubellimicrobium sp.]
MKRFAALFAALDTTTRTNAKVTALADYFREAPEPDRLWTVALFSGRRPRRTITATVLRRWAAERAGLPDWLFEDSYAVVGDLAETISLILPPPGRDSDDSLADWIARIRHLSTLPEDQAKAGILEAWDSLPPAERFLFTKLLTGGFRVGISQTLMVRALARALGRDEAELTHRLMGDWTPATTDWYALIEAPAPEADLARPYPFYLAHALDDPADLGEPSDWSAEYKWDGIRAQLVLRGGTHHLWSRGEELITDRFPEIAELVDRLPPGTVIDAELLAWGNDRPLPFAALQKRIGRKSVPRKLLSEAPALIMAYDLLEHECHDIRANPFATRRARLEALSATLPATAPLRLSPALPFASLEDLARLRAGAREMGAEGLMLKRRTSPYLAGRKRGDWWKWKVAPMTVDAVMVYAQAGHGRRADLYTDYTFAVRDGEALVPFTKAYSGLTDAEFHEITRWVRKNTLQRFGPVRQVPPELVFEIAFEGIQHSPRHKSGIALRFPRMLRWRRDKPVAEIDTIESLRALLEAQG